MTRGLWTALGVRCVGEGAENQRADGPVADRRAILEARERRIPCLHPSRLRTAAAERCIYESATGPIDGQGSQCPREPSPRSPLGQRAARSDPRCLLSFGVLLDRCKRRWDALLGKFEPVCNLCLSVGTEEFLEHRYATG